MPKEVRNALTPAKVRQEKNPGRYADGNGLYLNVSDTGARWWLWRGTVHGKRREIGIGSARLIDLKEAREIARSWRRIARDGGDPKAERDKEKREELTFERAARRVYAEQIEPHGRTQKHREAWINSLERYVLPAIGHRPIHTLTRADALGVLAPIWIDKAETARRVRQRIRTVMAWAIVAEHYSGNNPVDGVETGLPKQRDRVRHFAAMPYEDIPAFMQRLSGLETMGALVLRFLILTAARSAETRLATWQEIDLAGRLWVVPAERMKAGREHRVPLSDAALVVLDRVRGLSSGLVFPSNRQGRPLSNTTLADTMRDLRAEGTIHGFRAAFRTWAAEKTATPREIAEVSLAHQVGDAVERAYARSDILDKRRALMGQWGRFCLSAGAPGDVVELRR